MHPDVEQAINDFNDAMNEYGETCTIERSTAVRDSTGSAATAYTATSPPQSNVPCWVSSVSMMGGLREREVNAEQRAVADWANIQVPTSSDVEQGDRITLHHSGQQFEVREFGSDSIGISLILVCVKFKSHR